jgi:hypothetical protein
MFKGWFFLKARLFKGLIVYRPNYAGPDCARLDSVGRIVQGQIVPVPNKILPGVFKEL